MQTFQKQTPVDKKLIRCSVFIQSRILIVISVANCFSFEMSQLDFPSWLNSDFFQKILCNYYGNSGIQVKKVNVEPCNGANGGFLSTLLRVHVTYSLSCENNVTSYVVKIPTSHELAITKFGPDGLDVQRKEMTFYEFIAPLMDEVLTKLKDDTKLFPKVIAIDHEHEAIVLEDLTSLNFELADRIARMDESHMKLSLRKLAKFHAASLVIRQKNEEVFAYFKTGFFNREINAFNDFYLSIYEVAIEEIETWAGFEKYAIKMKKIKENLIESATQCFDIDQGDFCVLNHGDMWTNNLMFKYKDNGELDDAAMVMFKDLKALSKLKFI